MIVNLEKYCEQWSMEVNLDKSEIMVFRKGGRLAKTEEWYYRENKIRIT